MRVPSGTYPDLQALALTPGLKAHQMLDTPMSEKNPNREAFIDLRKRLGLTQPETAKLLAEKTSRPCGLRTIQAWEGNDDSDHSRRCDDWTSTLPPSQAFSSCPAAG